MTSSKLPPVVAFASSEPERTGDSRGDAIRVREVELGAADAPQRRREKLARIILDQMYQFVALLDPEGTLLEVNRAALEGAALKLEDIQGEPFWSVRWWTVSQEAQFQLQDAIRQAAQGEFVRYDVEVYGQAAGEETIIIDFSLNPVLDEHGSVVFLLAEGRNITEKKHAEAEIAHKNEQLRTLLQQVRELDEVKSQLFANISHELRTPLALILGPAEKMLADGHNLSALQRRDVDVMRRNAAVLLKLVNDLLDVAKLDAGKVELRYARIDVARLVRRLAANFEGIASQRRLAFVVDAPESVEAEIDAEKLERVIQNLLSNAFKFTPEGGRVKISVAAGEELLLSVQDSGSGVPPAERERIFERFRQANGGATRQFGGTGLGLAISRDFVHLHKGVITVTEAPGTGALFIVRLPLRAPEGEPVATHEATGLSEADSSMAGTLEQLVPFDAPVQADRDEAAGRPRVLIAEDNVELSRFLAECLQDDYQVQVALDGQDALEQVLERTPDLLLTDVMMPRLSGDQLVTAIRQRPQLDRLPIVVLTAKADDALRNRLLRNGAQDYLNKPFSSEELRARVANLLNLKLARDVLQGELDSQQQDLAVLARAVAERNRARDSALAEANLARDHARAASEAKSQFLQLVSHELRTPLQAMQLHLDLIVRQLGPDLAVDTGGRVPGLVARFQRSHGRMDQLVNTLLEAVRAETGAIEMACEDFDPGIMVSEVVEEMRPRATAKGLELAYSGQSSKACSDPRLFRIIVSNLVDNALKYTDTGRIEVLLHTEAGSFELRVSDTGPGIPQAQQELLFEPFVQLSDVRNKHHSGVGLGLHLSRRIAQRLGGVLSVESQLQRGSTFLLHLPKEIQPND